MRIFIIIGPSGSGKTTMGGFLKDYGIPELVSHTTREIREGEVDGVSYYFTNSDSIKEIDMIENSIYAGNTYGLSRIEVDSKLNQYENVFAITDFQGMTQIRSLYGDMVIPIFIEVELSDMIQRMTERGDSLDNITQRINYYKDNKESENASKCKYVVINKSLSQAKIQLLNIVKEEICLDKTTQEKPLVS